MLINDRTKNGAMGSEITCHIKNFNGNNQWYLEDNTVFL